jgi:class 3 adenylate cyclase
MRTVMGDPGDEELMLGHHVVESRASPVHEAHTTRASQLDWLAQNLPHMIDGTPGGKSTLRGFMDTPEAQRLVDEARAWRFPAWTGVIQWGPYGAIRYFAQRPRGVDGEEYGTIYLYGSALPATLLTLVARGDTRMFERMARLVEPGRREAAILFADLQASAGLARRLSTATYFSLLRSLLTSLDATVIERGGIVGKHAGDGATAFFLVDDLGSPSAAVRAAVEAAAGLTELVRGAAAESGEELVLNVGLHWGATVYMGQLVTDGRLEVTALGDEVNECARIQESARDGCVLASKALIEHLDDDDAAAIGIDPAAAVYEALADLPDATEKAVRDAGGLGVTRLPGFVPARPGPAPPGVRTPG